MFAKRCGNTLLPLLLIWALARPHLHAETSVTYAAGALPVGIASDGADIWVTNFGSGNVTKLLASTGAAVGAYSLGSAPFGIVFDGANIWVANEGDNTVTKLSPSTGAALGTYKVGALPSGIAFDGTNIWVANFAANTVTKLLASTGAAMGAYPVGSEPYAIAFDGSNIWVANYGGKSVTKLLASTGAAAGTYPVGLNPAGIAFDGSNIWVANEGDNTVTKLLASTGAPAGAYPVGSTPVGIAFDGTNIWVTNFADNTVTELRASTGASVATYTVGSEPYGIASVGGNIWLTNEGDNSITKISPLASQTAPPAPQTISFPPLSGIKLGSGPIALSAAASSGLTVVFASNSPSVCTVSGVTVTLLAAGTCSITASQSGNSVYAPATPVTQTFPVSSATAPPVITGLSPAAAAAGGPAFTLTVGGTGFSSGAAVQWNGSALSTTFVSPTQLTASVPAGLIANPGAASITVFAAGATPSSSLAFTINAVAIASLSPNAASPGSPSFSLVVNGTGFVLTSTVQWNGASLATSFFDSAQLIAAVPASLVASPGTASITVVNPGGSTTSPATFSINGLNIAGLNPASAVAGGPAFTLSATGTGFAPGSSVVWNGTALTTTFVSSTQLTAAVPASLIANAGAASVTVGSGAAASNSLAFPINALTLKTLSPAAGTAGGPAFVLALNGAGFVSGSTVQWNGSPLTTTFVNAGQLQAAVPAGLVASSGAATVGVAIPQGPASNSLSFPIAAAKLTITTASLPSGTVGAAYAQNLTASGGTPPYNNWIFGSGALPPGLTLDASAGTIAGIPGSAAGSPYNVGVLVKDITGAVAAAKNLSIAVNQPSALAIVTANPLHPGTVGVPYSQSFEATSGTAPYVNWSIAAGTPPPGTTFSQVSSGSVDSALLSGTPAASGPFSFTVQVTDSVGAAASIPFSLNIAPANTITIYSSGIVNSASYLGGSVAPGELVTIFGTGMGPVALASLQLDNAGNVATTLAGVQVLFDGRPAPLIYVSSTQLGAVVPYEVSGQTSTQVQVTWQGQTSNTITVPVVHAAPGIYTLNASGSGGGAVLNVDGTVNSATNPAAPGSYVFVYATGEGQTNPPGLDGALNGFPAPVPSQIVTATIGGIDAYVEYAGGVAGLVAGVIQVNLQIPQGVTPGNNVPLLINIGGATTQTGVTIAALQ
jgi:uncharacterized protein (TIGR03437 family)